MEVRGTYQVTQFAICVLFSLGSSPVSPYKRVCMCQRALYTKTKRATSNQHPARVRHMWCFWVCGSLLRHIQECYQTWKCLKIVNPFSEGNGTPERKEHMCGGPCENPQLIASIHRLFAWVDLPHGTPRQTDRPQGSRGLRCRNLLTSEDGFYAS